MKKIFFPILFLAVFITVFATLKGWHTYTTTPEPPFSATAIHNYLNDIGQYDTTGTHAYLYRYRVAIRNRSATNDTLVAVHFGIQTGTRLVDYTDTVSISYMPFNFSVNWDDFYLDTLDNSSLLIYAKSGSCLSFRQLGDYY